MEVLVDTNVFLWSLSDETRLSTRARRIFRNPKNVLVFSAVVSWEIVIKMQVGKLVLPDTPSRYLSERVTQLGMRHLPIDVRHTLLVESLPMYHRDPFDRLLAAQSHLEALPILTRNPVFQHYDVKVIW